MRALIVSLPQFVMAGSLFLVFCALSVVARRLIIRSFSEDVRGELAEQANNLLTGVSATFALFVGFAISISWGAVNAAQTAVERQAADVQRMSWEIRNIPDPAAVSALGDKLLVYARAAADDDARFLALGRIGDLPSAAALDNFEDAVRAYASGPGAAPAVGPGLVSAASSLVSSSAGVAAVASRAIPRPMVALLFIVAVLVTIILGVTTVTSGRASMIFICIWCIIPALSIAVVLALAFPFALRTGMTLAPMRAAAQSLPGS